MLHFVVLVQCSASHGWNTSCRQLLFYSLFGPCQIALFPPAEGSNVPGITTGDSVQAATALLLHSVLGRPLLPVAPKRMAVMVQARDT